MTCPTLLAITSMIFQTTTENGTTRLLWGVKGCTPVRMVYFTPSDPWLNQPPPLFFDNLHTDASCLSPGIVLSTVIGWFYTSCVSSLSILVILTCVLFGKVLTLSKFVGVTSISGCDVFSYCWNVYSILSLHENVKYTLLWQKLRLRRRPKLTSMIYSSYAHIVNIRSNCWCSLELLSLTNVDSVHLGLI